MRVNLNSFWQLTIYLKILLKMHLLLVSLFLTRILNLLWREVVAAGFLRKVEGGYGLLDGYITNKNYPSQGRDIALDLLTKELLRMCKLLKIRQIFAFTNHSTIIERALAFGFEQQLFQKVIVKNLSGEQNLWHS